MSAALLILLQLGSLIGGSLISEDATGIAAGILVRKSALSWPVATLGCYLGVIAGDGGLWLLGRWLGRPALKHAWIQKRLTEARRKRIEQQLRDHAGWTIFVARFSPALRFPTFVAAGMFNLSAKQFAFWTLVSAAIWTPLLLVLSALLGEIFLRHFHTWGGAVWFLSAMAIAVPALRPSAVRWDLIACRVYAQVSRIWRWEFWPTWLFYLPLLPWLAILAIRYRSCTVWTAANPGIPLGGVVDESKFDILQQLQREAVLRACLIPAGDIDDRMAVLRKSMHKTGLLFPAILKPDKSQRGAAVKRIHTEAEARRYLELATNDVIVQEYHAGPHEAGVFYYRLPSESRGKIFSITEKVFPVLQGDGRSTIEELIWRHPRFRMQASVFLARFAQQRNRVLLDGELFPLAQAGNHCQGTLFREGGHLMTQELEIAIDRIAKQFTGFYFGRFDIRYSEESAFRAGRDLAIVELNGVTSESTNIYDPSRSLFSAYWILAIQWEICFRIGNANRKMGIESVTWGELRRRIGKHCRRQPVAIIAD